MGGLGFGGGGGGGLEEQEHGRKERGKWDSQGGRKWMNGKNIYNTAGSNSFEDGPPRDQIEPSTLEGCSLPLILGVCFERVVYRIIFCNR